MVAAEALHLAGRLAVGGVVVVGKEGSWNSVAVVVVVDAAVVVVGPLDSSVRVSFLVGSCRFEVMFRAVSENAD